MNKKRMFNYQWKKEEQFSGGWISVFCKYTINAFLFKKRYRLGKRVFFFSSLLRSGEARLTRIALAIVWLFIFCHAWRLIPTIYEAFYPGDDSLPTWLRHIHGISHSFIVFNSAVNFLLYTLLWIRIMTVYSWILARQDCDIT